MSTLPNYDYDAENVDLTRRQKLADTMLQSGMSPMDPLGPGVRQSPLAVVAKILQAYLGTKMGSDVKDQRTALATRYKADAQSGLNDFINGISTTAGTTDPGVQVPGTNVPGQQAMGAPEGNNPSAFVPPTTVTPQDAQRKHIEAVTNAMASNNPILQQLAQSQLGKMLSPQNPIDMKTLFEKGDDQTRSWMLTHPNQVPPQYKSMQEFKAVSPGEVLAGVNTGEVKTPGTGQGGPAGGGSAAGVPAGFSLVDTPGLGIQIVREASTGDLYQRTSTGLKKLDNAPKTTVNNKTVVNSGENAFAKGVGELNAKELGDLRTRADSARKMAPVLGKLEQLTNSGTYAGPMANANVWMGELASSLGMPVDPKLANSEAYAGVLSKQISNYLTAGAGVGRSLTDADREELTKQFPTLVRTPEGRAHIISTLRQANTNDIKQGDAAEAAVAQRFPELRRLVPGGLASSPAPGDFSPAPPVGQPTVSNWPGAR